MLEKIKWPKDLKHLTNPELIELASQMRQALITRANIVGWHFWPNLGMVEATIALHKVFNSPVDKFVFDVSHQSYPHKMLTWRMEAYTNPEKYGSVSGYTLPSESPHDNFFVWHTSTSISLATWLAKARDLKWDNENIIAIIWDGSMSWWMAYEWLNVASELNSNIIIIVNDNDMSIAENHGWLYKNLKLLRETNWKAENNFFTSLWLEYYFIKDGHNFEELLEVFSKVKDSKKAVVVHMFTVKWKWSEFGETFKEAWHYIMPWMLNPDFKMPDYWENYSSITANYVLEKIKTDKTVIAMTPATPMLTWFFEDFRQKAWSNYIDVWIAEEQAVTMASGIAKNGWKPILAMWSPFVQRTYDQLSHDLALNSNPATILIAFNWIWPWDATHNAIYDIPMISNIPNIVFLAPTTKEEYLTMLDWSVDQTKHPVVIRIPSGTMISSWFEDKTDYNILNKYDLVNSWSEIVIIWLGSFYHLWEKVKELIDKELNINSTLINPKFASWIDKEMLEELKKNHKVVITLEDWGLEWGFGEKITRFYGVSNMKVLNYWAQKEFTDRVPLSELYEKYHLTPELILADIKEIL